MSESDERQVQRDALHLLHTLIAASESQDWQEADSFVVLVTDDETHSISLYTPFDDPIEAIVWAEKQEAELNRGAPPSEIPFVARVYPAHKPS